MINKAPPARPNVTGSGVGVSRFVMVPLQVPEQVKVDGVRDPAAVPTSRVMLLMVLDTVRPGMAKIVNTTVPSRDGLWPVMLLFAFV
jgi:hypothetical protein